MKGIVVPFDDNMNVFGNYGGMDNENNYFIFFQIYFLMGRVGG